MLSASLPRLAAGTFALVLGAPFLAAAAQSPPRFAAAFGPGLDVELVSRAFAAADLDGDGRLDLVLQRPGGRLLLGLGKGAWRDAPELLPADFGEQGGAVVAGDLDGDGDVDLVATRAGVHEAFLNAGPGFVPAGGVASLVAVAPPAVPPQLELRLADFNLDGHLDLLQAAGSAARLHAGDGSGGFSGPSLDLPFTLTGSIRSLDESDANGDGWSDVLASDGERTQLLVGSPAGSFSLLLDLPLAAPVLQLDLDLDGDLDLVGAEPGSAALRVFRADSGAAAPLAAVPLAAAPTSLAAIDLDADGALDLVALLDGAPAVGLSNDGLGGFSALPGEPVAGGLGDAERLFARDLDGDGDLDLLGLVDPFGAAAAGALAFASDAGALQRVARRAVPHPLEDPDGLGDFDGDGRLDLVRPLGPAALAADPEAVTSWMDLGFGRYVPSEAPPMALPFDDLSAYAAGDLNADGRLDVLAGGRAIGVGGALAPAPLTLLAGDGLGGAQEVPGFGGLAFRAIQDICLLDANGDGFLDAYLSIRDTVSLVAVDIAMGNMGGLGLQPSSLALPDYAGSSLTAEAFDADLDGDLDLFLGQRADPAAPWLTAQDTLLINNGGGVYFDQTAARLPLQPTLTRSVELGDVDADGDTDVWVVVDEGGAPDAPAPNGDALLLNDGAGVFSDAGGLLPATSAGDGPGALADVDLDGRLDLLELAPGASRVAFNSPSGFAVELPLIGDDVALPTSELAVADIDTDGDADLLHGLGLWRGLRRELSVASLTSLGASVRIEVTTLGPPTVWVLGYALGGAWFQLPPLGQLGLDLSAGFTIVGSGPVTPSEPLGLQLPVPELPQLVGLEVHWQALVDFPLQLTRAVSREVDEL